MGGLISGMVDIGMAFPEADAERQASSLQYNREQRQANLAIASAQEKGAFESGKQRMLTSQFVAKQRQAYANSGVDATKGTAAAVQADTQALGELDAQQISINAAREAWGYKKSKEQSAKEYQLRGANIERKQLAGVLGGFAKGIGGGLSSMK